MFLADKWELKIYCHRQKYISYFVINPNCIGGGEGMRIKNIFDFLAVKTQSEKKLLYDTANTHDKSLKFNSK